jgi:hypothetical protein
MNTRFYDGNIFDTLLRDEVIIIMFLLWMHFLKGNGPSTCRYTYVYYRRLSYRKQFLFFYLFHLTKRKISSSFFLLIPSVIFVGSEFSIQ